MFSLRHTEKERGRRKNQEGKEAGAGAGGGKDGKGQGLKRRAKVGVGRRVRSMKEPPSAHHSAPGPVLRFHRRRV